MQRWPTPPSIRNAIKEAIDLFNEGKWKPPSQYTAPESQGEDSGEEFDFSDPDSSDEGSGWETEEEVTAKLVLVGRCLRHGISEFKL